MTLINGFLSYLLLMVITLSVAFAAGFSAIYLRKRKDAGKKAVETDKEKN